MPISKERKQEIEQFRTSVLKVAQQMAADEGWENVSQRKIASQIGVSAALLYSYFKNKQEIMQGIQELGLKDLQKRLKVIEKTEQDPKNSILRMTSQYFEFALHNPELYRVIFRMEGANVALPNDEMLKKISKQIKKPLKSLVNKKKELNSAFLLWWSMVHGFTSLHLTQTHRTSSKKARNELSLLAKKLVEILS
jgi:AcrR family transcriptional regulator